MSKPSKIIETLNLHMPNMHGNLKFILNNPLSGKYVKYFRNKNDIIDIVSAYCEEGGF